MASPFILHNERVVPADRASGKREAGEPRLGVLIVFSAIVAIALIGAIVLYAIDKDTAAQIILPVGTGLLGLLTGRYLGESASKSG